MSRRYRQREQHVFEARQDLMRLSRRTRVFAPASARLRVTYSVSRQRNASLQRSRNIGRPPLPQAPDSPDCISKAAPEPQPNKMKVSISGLRDIVGVRVSELAQRHRRRTWLLDRVRSLMGTAVCRQCNPRYNQSPNTTFASFQKA
jgi:hypothetical protein